MEPKGREVEEEFARIEKAHVFSRQQFDYLILIYQHPGLSAYQLADKMQTNEGQIRKLAAVARDQLPVYFNGPGAHDPIRIEHADRGYMLTARYTSTLGPLTPEDKELFAHANALKEFRAESKFALAVDILHPLYERYPSVAPLAATLAEVHVLRAVHCTVLPDEAIALAEPLVQSALRLDPDLWLAHATLCLIRIMQFRWSDAQKALETSESLHAHAHLHPSCAAFRVAIRSLDGHIARLQHEEENAEFRPLAFQVKANLCISLFYQKQYCRELSILNGLLQIHPTYHLLHTHAGLANIGLEHYQEALHHLDIAAEQEGGKYFTPGLRIYCLGRLGRVQEALLSLEMLKYRAATIYTPVHQFACAYAGLGDDEATYECLETAIAEHDIQATALHAWPQFFHLHGQKRFADCFKKMGLPPP